MERLQRALGLVARILRLGYADGSALRLPRMTPTWLRDHDVEMRKHDAIP